MKIRFSEHTDEALIDGIAIALLCAAMTEDEQQQLSLSSAISRRLTRRPARPWAADLMRVAAAETCRELLADEHLSVGQMTESLQRVLRAEEQVRSQIRLRLSFAER